MRVPLTLLRPWLPQDYRLLEDPGQPLLALPLTFLAFILLRRQGLHDQWKLLLQERASGCELGCLAAMPMGGSPPSSPHSRWCGSPAGPPSESLRP